MLHSGKNGADTADVAHDVQLPHGIPLLVGQLLESDLIGLADVVD